MFGFETNIGIISRSVNSPADAVETITFDYCLSRRDETTNPTDANGILMLRVKELVLPDFISNLLLGEGMSPTYDNKYISSDSIKINSQNFKSVGSPVTKSIDHFVQLRNAEIGCNHKYVKNHGQIHVIFQKYDTIERMYHLMRIKQTEQYKVYPCSEIHCKLLYMEFGCFEIAAWRFL